jgi:hypothetical protein
MAINGTPVIETQTGNPPQACNGTDPLPSNTALNTGDNLKFQINLCNDQGTASANGISLSDTLINLQMPTGGWNVQYCDGGSCGSVTPTVTGTAPNQTLSFSLSSIAKASIANLTFNAVLAPPSGNTSSTSRFQNSFVVNYTANSPVSGHTPLIPFYTGSNTPTIHEVP